MLAGYDCHPRGTSVWEAWESDVRVPGKILSCVVFIGLDENGPFSPLGTGFLAVKETGGRLFQQVVTARHVVEGVKASRICIRINLRDGRVERTYVEPGEWRFHPDETVDLAICPTHIPPETYEILHMNVDQELATKDVIAEEYIGIGDDVFIAGMFTRHIGEVSNRPIVRTGTIAAMPTEKIYTGRGYIFAYLVEARSIAGLSGSPVFVQMAPFRVMDDGGVRRSAKRTHYFLGIMQGHFITKDPMDVVSPDDEVPGDMNTGIGVVIPGERLCELIDIPEFKDKREAIVEKLKSESGFVEDSAAGKAPPTKDENPQHTEAFNSLLDAAVKGPQSADQT